MIALLDNDEASLPVRGYDPGTSDEEDSGKILACARCRRPITTTAARIEVAGAHAHTFTNPGGFVFRLACFREASGLCRISPQSSEATWFAGYTWQIEVCAGCREQLGWLYRSGELAFHGLIVDCLIEVPG
jgi:hypothetical protein